MNIIDSYTVKTLKKNKTRTLVTVAGIILSAAMLTAVIILCTSLQQFCIKVAIEKSGNWFGCFTSADSYTVNAVESDERVNGFVKSDTLGIGMLEGGKNPEKPYVAVCSADSAFFDAMPVDIYEGRLPENGSEIIIPRHVYTNGRVDYAVGDTISVNLGKRYNDGNLLSAQSSYTDTEELRTGETRTYTVVGLYERADFEPYWMPAYTLLTYKDASDVPLYSDIYFKTPVGRDAYRVVDDIAQDDSSVFDTGRCNTDYLRFIGQSDEMNLNTVLYGLASILLLIIMVASVSLIYNAFSISVSERTKQFGLLSSVGATKKQLIRSVLCEAAVLSALGVPLGILAGIAGIAVTLKATSSQFAAMFAGAAGLSFTLSFTLLAVVAAALTSVFTVLVSAYIPARRAVRLSAIDAIRQTNDIAVRGRDVKGGKLSYRLFGLPGMIAGKNFRRNRRKYRTTVISLFISVVIFISSSSFCAYLEKSLDDVIQHSDSDISYSGTFYNADEITALGKSLSACGAVKKSAVTAYAAFSAYPDTQLLSADFDKVLTADDSGTYSVFTAVCFVEDGVYREYLEENGFDAAKFMSTENPAAIACDYCKKFNSLEEKYYSCNIFSEKEFSLRLSAADSTVTANVGAVLKDSELPLGLSMFYGQCVTLMYPLSAADAVLGGSVADCGLQARFAFTSDDPSALYDEMLAVIGGAGYDTESLENEARLSVANRSLIVVADVFIYGFIVLISLIAVANVFNTVSTNLRLRRREFATLRSIGMTKRGFNMMMNYECLLYGLKALVIGLPVSFAVTALIYVTILNGYNISFFIPVSSVITAVVGVFAVVFASMIYSMKSINRDNTADALKDENI